MQLIGSPNVTIPEIMDEEEAQEEVELAEFIGLPIDEKPRLAFFNWRV